MFKIGDLVKYSYMYLRTCRNIRGQTKLPAKNGVIVGMAPRNRRVMILWDGETVPEEVTTHAICMRKERAGTASMKEKVGLLTDL